jgi:hypothetical protein
MSWWRIGGKDAQTCPPRQGLPCWLAAETGVVEIMTADVVDFSRYRLPRNKAFVLL